VSASTGERGAAIRGAGLSKTFRLPHEKRTTLREHVLHPLQRTEYETQNALVDVSFEVRGGEFFGVVGRNGSGKSTLLKILAGIYRPDAGTLEVNGKLSPFIELGAGFNPELNGRDNLRINATLLGLSAREVEERFDAIVEFAELERFMDRKLKNYSSGMQVRLAYSIAIQVPFDILLVDEVLAVGDQRFQQKCGDTFEAMRTSGKTVVLVTHDLASVNRFCDRSLLLHDGAVQAVGRSAGVIEAYLKQEELRAGVSHDQKGDLASISKALRRRARSSHEALEAESAEKPIPSREQIGSMAPEKLEELICDQQGKIRNSNAKVLELLDRVRAMERAVSRAADVTHFLLRRHYEDLPVPPESLRLRWGSATDELDFLAEGLIAAEAVRIVFGETPSRPILEWGVDGGQSIRWLSCYPDWVANYHGCDPDPEAVAWLSSNASFRVEVCPEEPPLPYPPATFSGVVALNMLTRLDPREHARWFAELGRLLHPGGLAYVVTNGPFLVEDDGMREALQAQGWAYDPDGPRPPRAYVTEEFTRGALEGFFAVEAYQPSTSTGTTAYAVRRVG